jgi:hypothetical protein
VTKPQDLTFQEEPTFELGSNTFKDVPVVLQFGDTPLIEISQWENASYGVEFRIYNKDGVYLAKIRGNQIYRTEAGEKSNLFLRHPGDKTVCELDGKTLFELKREGAAALKGTAELFTPDGRFIKITNDYMIGNLLRREPNLGFPIGHALIWVHDLIITGGSIGLHYFEREELLIGVGGDVRQKLIGRPEPPLFRPKLPWVKLELGRQPDGTSARASNISIKFLKELP